MPILLVNLLFLGAPLPQTQATLKVGAWGDDASRNNIGVQVSIETHTYGTPENTFDYFWVGDDLTNGGFIQFGYSLEPGLYCLEGTVFGGRLTCVGRSDLILSSDARWQWQYWPDRSKANFYYEIGPSGSAGSNASVHQYTIAPSISNTWSFFIDRVAVAATTFPVTPASNPAFIVAEGTASNTPQSLGPVRFTGLAYYTGARWNQVDSLVALTYCGTDVACEANQYGAIAIGPDSILAGSGVSGPSDGALLWTSEDEILHLIVHPGVQFSVTSTLGTETYEGNASIALPKGMIARVSLSDTNTSTPGVLGWLGGRDQFAGWMGSVSSQNTTIQVLMDSNKNLTTIWITNAAIPEVALIAGLVTVLAVTIAALVRKAANNPEKDYG